MSFHFYLDAKIVFATLDSVFENLQLCVCFFCCIGCFGTNKATAVVAAFQIRFFFLLHFDVKKAFTHFPVHLTRSNSQIALQFVMQIVKKQKICVDKVCNDYTKKKNREK